MGKLNSLVMELKLSICIWKVIENLMLTITEDSSCEVEDNALF